MGEIGRTRIEQQFAWKYSIVNLLAAYDRAFEKNSRLTGQSFSQAR